VRVFVFWESRSLPLFIDVRDEPYLFIDVRNEPYLSGWPPIF
jgi:hypothetical protein